LLTYLAMPASGDMVLRLVRRLSLPEPDTAQIMGVDDWAMRKGRTDGTIVVNLERLRVLDRTAEMLADWLRRQPSDAVVARDRATENMPAASPWDAPDAVQVADRWNLLANMRQVLERWLARAHARLRRLPPGPGLLADAQPGRGPGSLHALGPRRRPASAAGSGGSCSLKRSGDVTPLVRGCSRSAGR
jgi:hypothetical protein